MGFVRKANALLVLTSVIGSVSISSQTPKQVKKTEVAGEKPATSISIADSTKSAAESDSLTYDFLSELFSVVESEREKKAETVDSAETLSVLDFLSKTYDTNGFYESGNLAKPSGKRKPKIYEGELPKIDEKRFCRPVKGKITSSFGYRENSEYFHLGVDMAGKSGDTVRVALPGKVIRSRFDRGGYGWYVCVLDSAGIETRYAHMSKVLVKKGDVLKEGEAVGLVGMTGNSTGPHLHFEMRYKSRVINPMFYMMR